MTSSGRETCCHLRSEQICHYIRSVDQCLCSVRQLTGLCLPVYTGRANPVPAGRGHRGSGRSHRVQKRGHHSETEAAESFSQYVVPVGDEPHGQTQLPVGLRDQSPALQIL